MRLSAVLSCLIVMVLCHPVQAYKMATHEQLIGASLDQLHADGMRTFAIGDFNRAFDMLAAEAKWRKYLAPLKLGAIDVDRYAILFEPASWTIHHGWNPSSNAGWFGAMPCTDLADKYERQALNHASVGDFDLVAWKTGAVIHFIHDETVPAHVACDLNLIRHNQYESVCESLNLQFSTKVWGIYQLPNSSEQSLRLEPASTWIKHAATISNPYNIYVGDSDLATGKYDEQVGILLMHEAVRLGAGYLYYAYFRTR